MNFCRESSRCENLGMEKRMRVLWVCNIVLPRIAERLGMPKSNKEGWLSGISETLLEDEESEIELGVCFPVGQEKDGVCGEAGGLSYYGFYEDTEHPENYDVELEGRLAKILEQFRPDVVHVFGSEFPHTLAMAKVFGKRDRLLISMQGICSECAKSYTIGVPSAVCKKKTFRDWLKKDNILQQQEKFVLRGQNEKAALSLTGNVAGRTAWDKQVLKKLAKDAKYFKWNETLRSNFYGKEWKLENCEKYSIFVSQGNYTIKGLHFVLQAMPEILKRFPDTKLYVAGDKITAYSSLKDKIKIGTYGQYLLQLISKNGLQEKVIFLGKQDAEEMCGQFLKSHVFLSASLIENSPNSVGEAMLLGVPVVSSEVGGVPSLFEGEKEGLFYPVEDTKKLSAQIVRIFEDDALAERLSGAAKVRAAKTHHPKTNYERLLEIYHEINVCV